MIGKLDRPTVAKIALAAALGEAPSGSVTLRDVATRYEQRERTLIVAARALRADGWVEIRHPKRGVIVAELTEKGRHAVADARAKAAAA